MLDRALTRPSLRPLGAVALAALVSACSLTTAQEPATGIGFRQARFEEVAALREYRTCRDEGIALDAQARSSANPGRYLASARLLEKCETMVGPEAAGVARDERMRAYAVAVQNHVKGGDLAAARAALDKLRQAFPGADLYLADGSSWSETMTALLGQTDQKALGSWSTLNVADAVKQELRRKQYWTRN